MALPLPQGAVKGDVLAIAVLKLSGLMARAAKWQLCVHVGIPEPMCTSVEKRMQMYRYAWMYVAVEVNVLVVIPQHIWFDLRGRVPMSIALPILLSCVHSNYVCK